MNSNNTKCHYVFHNINRIILLCSALLCSALLCSQDCIAPVSFVNIDFYCVHSLLAIAVHFLVVVLILAADDGLPPLTVIEIPLDRLLDAVLELGLRQPAQLIVDLSRVDGVTHIMTLTVANMGNQTLRLTQLFADDLYNLDVLLLVVTADIVDLANTTLVDNQVDSLAVVFHIQPVADIQALTVNRQRLVSQSISDHQRNELLREVIRTIVVGATRDRHR